MPAVMCRFTLIAALAALAGTWAVLAQRTPAMIYLFLALLVVRAWRATRQGQSLWAHGTARATGMLGLLYQRMLGDQGLILGRAGGSARPSFIQAAAMLFNPAVPSDLACQAFLGMLYDRWATERIIRVNDYVHLLTCSPAGGGKSVSVLVPNLRAYAGSCVVTDPKGELWALTALHRKKKLGHQVVLLDPFGICNAGSAAFNTLDFIDVNMPEFLDQCRDLANMLVVRTGEEKEPHWNDSAELVLTAFIAFVCACEPDRSQRSLATVRKLVSSRERFTLALEIMQKTPGFQSVIANLGHQLTWPAGRELASVMTTVQRHTAWMDSPLVAHCLSHSSYDPRLLRSSRVTVYFVLPPERLVTLAPLMRVWIGSTIRISTRGVPSERNPVLFLLDEAGHLGHMQALEDAVTLMRGYGIRLWFFFQSLGQLTECYGKRAPVILDNLGTQQYFAINSLETAEAISRRIGETTIEVGSRNGGRGDSWPVGPSATTPQPGNQSRNWGWSVTQLGRRLYKPEEILVLPRDMALIFHKNLPVIPARLLTYYAAREFRNGGAGRQCGLGVAGLLTAVHLVLLAGFLAAVADAFPPATPAAPVLQGTPPGGVPARMPSGSPGQSYRPANAFPRYQPLPGRPSSNLKQAPRPKRWPPATGWNAVRRQGQASASPNAGDAGPGERRDLRRLPFPWHRS